MDTRSTRLLRRANPAPVARPSHFLRIAFTLLLLAAGMAGVARAQDDLPGRVGRVADFAGELFLAPQDKPDQWAPIGLNYPVTGGDNLWAGNEARAEIDYGGGQFRMAADTNLHLSRLDDHQFALFVAQGRVIVRIRVLDPGDIAYVDTPNAQLQFTRPGLYRVEVADDRQRTLLAVREGEANVLTGGATQQVLPGQSAFVDGTDPRYADVRNGIGSDGFDTWSASRDRRYHRSRSTSYVSRQMVGYADLDEYGTWSQVPEYGAVWYPSGVASNWAPYRNGYWVDVGTWGPTWVDYAPWGYAPFHYGRWAYIGGRWGWCPGAYVARPYWAPAMVGWAGGPGWGLSVSAGAPVYGWVPLAWGEPYRPWWGRCSTGCWDRYNRPYAVNVAERRNAPPTRYVNWTAPGGISAVSSATFVARKPVQANLVNVPIGMVATAPVMGGAPLVRAEPGRIPDRRPQGAPPPASTFYPTAARPAATSPTGMVTLPGGNQAAAVPPGSRSRNPVDPAKPLQVAPPSAVPPAGGGRNVAAPSPGGLLAPTQPPPQAAVRQPQGSAPPANQGAPGGMLSPVPQAQGRPGPQAGVPIPAGMVSVPPPQPQGRPAPQAMAPAPGGSVAVPPARVDGRTQNRAPQSTYIGAVPPPTHVVPAPPNVSRPVTRPQPVTPVPPTMVVPGPAPAPVQAPVSRQAPVAPSAPAPSPASPGMVMGAPMAAPPAAPTAPAAPGGGGLVRQR
jgi:hypothetical protein